MKILHPSGISPGEFKGISYESEYSKNPSFFSIVIKLKPKSKLILTKRSFWQGKIFLWYSSFDRKYRAFTPDSEPMPDILKQKLFRGFIDTIFCLGFSKIEFGENIEIRAEPIEVNINHNLIRIVVDKVIQIREIIK